MIALALLLQILNFLIRPEEAVCPRGWHAEGVRRSGHTTCLLPGYRDPSECYRNNPCPGGPPPVARLPVKVWCPLGTRPVVFGARVVRCADTNVYKEQW